MAPAITRTMKKVLPRAMPKCASPLNGALGHRWPCSEDGVPLSDGADVDGVSVGALLTAIGTPQMYSGPGHSRLIMVDVISWVGVGVGHVHVTGEVVGGGGSGGGVVMVGCGIRLSWLFTLEPEIRIDLGPADLVKRR